MWDWEPKYVETMRISFRLKNYHESTQRQPMLIFVELIKEVIRLTFTFFFFSFLPFSLNSSLRILCVVEQRYIPETKSVKKFYKIF